MKAHGKDKKTVKHRQSLTIITTVAAGVLSGISFVLMLLRVPNMHVVFYLILGLSFLVIVYMALWTLDASEKRARLARNLRRCYFIFLAIGLAFFITLQGLIVSGARTEEADVDCLIVLGAGLRNGSPSLMLRQRLNMAAEYLLEHGDTPIIVSGGMGRGETITEAEAMSRYLVACGVDESLIWKEEKSTSTRENLVFSMDLMEENGLDTDSVVVAVVTNEFHLYRAKLIAAKTGLTAIGISAKTPRFYLRVLYSFREAFALATEILFR